MHLVCGEKRAYLLVENLLIIPRAGMGSESIAHSAEEATRKRGIIVLVKSN